MLCLREATLRGATERSARQRDTIGTKDGSALLSSEGRLVEVLVGEGHVCEVQFLEVLLSCRARDRLSSRRPLSNREGPGAGRRGGPPGQEAGRVILKATLSFHEGHRVAPVRSLGSGVCRRCHWQPPIEGLRVVELLPALVAFLRLVPPIDVRVVPQEIHRVRLRGACPFPTWLPAEVLGRHECRLLRDQRFLIIRVAR